MIVDDFGRINITSDELIDVWLKGKDIQAIVNDEQYNRYVKFCETFSKDEFIIEEPESILHQDRQEQWAIPEEYYNIDIEKLCYDRCNSDEEILRVNDELLEFKKRNLYIMLKTLLFIVDRMREENIVWGVGRGSSVASLVLNKIGIHKIDPLRHKLDYKEFLR